MILMMDSATWDQKYTKNERPDIVYHSQYAIMSNRIRKTSANKHYPNIKLMNNTIMPNTYVEQAIDRPTYKKRYKEYLKEPAQMIKLATLIELSLNYYPLIFITTPIEYNQLDYMKVLAAFIYKQFGCPVVNYKKHQDILRLSIDSDIPLVDAAKVKDRIDHLQEKAIEKRHYTSLNTANWYNTIRERAEVAPKKRLKRILKDHDAWEKGLDIQDMVNRYMTFECYKDSPV